jgi:hypothetical protein
VEYIRRSISAASWNRSKHMVRDAIPLSDLDRFTASGALDTPQSPQVPAHRLLRLTTDGDQIGSYG